METNEEIEMMLWEYMDGTCSATDMQRISILVERDDLWKQKYAELYAFQAQIEKSLQPEQPSMRFTKNVMDAVATVRIAPATKQYINKGIIRGIAAFFIVSIAAMFGYALVTANWSASSSGPVSQFSLNKLNLGNYFNSSTLNIVIAINVAIGLVLLDTFLRRKKDQHSV